MERGGETKLEADGVDTGKNEERGLSVMTRTTRRAMAFMEAARESLSAIRDQRILTAKLSLSLYRIA
jgi:phytoene/squalene synthetase